MSFISFLKHLMSICLLIISTASAQNVDARERMGTGSSGGGDPQEIEAPVYPDQMALSKALSEIAQAVQQSPYPHDFTQEVIAEIELLQQRNAFRVLPAIVLMPAMGRTQGYEMPAEKDHFVSLGGLTEFKKGASIYLADRVQKYTKAEFKEILLHEVLHHVLESALTSDELFVKDLTNSILDGKTSPSLELAMTQGIYLLPNHVRRDQFATALDFKELSEFLHWRQLTKETAAMKRLQFSTKLPLNLATLPIAKVRDVICELLDFEPRRSGFDMQFCQHVQRYLEKKAGDWRGQRVPAKEIPKKFYEDWGCKREITRKARVCEPENSVRMNELFYLN